MQCDSAGANCAAIAGATTNSYTVESGDVGRRLRAVVTATNAVGTSPPATSAATVAIPA
jgi:hypothetical protein